MEILIIAVVTSAIVTPIVAITGLFIFKKEVINFYDMFIKNIFSDTDNNTRRNFGRAARVLPLSNYPVAPKKEIELPKRYIVITNPENNISLGIESN